MLLIKRESEEGYSRHKLASVQAAVLLSDGTENRSLIQKIISRMIDLKPALTGCCAALNHVISPRAICYSATLSAQHLRRYSLPQSDLALVIAGDRYSRLSAAAT